jgi:hypothetical protein
MRYLPILGLSLMLGACTTTDTGSGASIAPRASDEAPFGYTAEYDRLKTDCAARGGYLTPLGRSNTGRPQTDYACTIRGGASDLLRE